MKILNIQPGVICVTVIVLGAGFLSLNYFNLNPALAALSEELTSMPFVPLQNQPRNKVVHPTERSKIPVYPTLSRESVEKQNKKLSITRYYQDSNLRWRREVLLDWCCGLTDISQVFASFRCSLEENPTSVPLYFLYYLNKDNGRQSVDTIDDQTIALYVFDHLTNHPSFTFIAEDELMLLELKADLHNYLVANQAEYSYDETLVER